jgi:hypothetical protein
MRHPTDRPTRVTISVPLPSHWPDLVPDDQLQRAISEAEGLAADLIGPDALCLQQVGSSEQTCDDDGAWLTVTTMVR